MRYADQLPFFRRELSRCGRPFPTLSFGSFQQVMVRAPTPAADEACRVFAVTLEWPPMPEDVRLEVCLRLVAAIEWIEAESTEAPFPDEHGSDALAGLLIEYWRDVQPELASLWKEWPRCGFPPPLP